MPVLLCQVTNTIHQQLKTTSMCCLPVPQDRSPSQLSQALSSRSHGPVTQVGPMTMLFFICKYLLLASVRTEGLAPQLAVTEAPHVPYHMSPPFLSQKEPITSFSCFQPLTFFVATRQRKPFSEDSWDSIRPSWLISFLLNHGSKCIVFTGFTKLKGKRSTHK